MFSAQWQGELFHWEEVAPLCLGHAVSCGFAGLWPQSLRLQGMGGCPAHFEHDPHLEQGGVLSVPSVVTDKNTQGGPPGMIPEGLDSWSGATPFLSPYCEIKSTSEMMTPQAEGHQGAWYFYPSGLRTFHPAMLSWLAAKGSSRRQDVCESGEFTPDFQELESGVLQHMSEWQGLSQEDSQDKRPKEMASLEAQLAGLRQELAAISQRQAAMAQEIHLWREKMVALRSDMESHVPALIQEYFVGDKGTKAGLTQLEEVQAQLWDLEQRLLRHMAEEQDKTASKVAADLRLTLLEEGVTTGVTEEEVREIVRQALKLYSEDRIGLVDYALESSGASILSSHSSETYGTRTAVISLFGIPLWYHFQTQRAIIQPNVYPGNCWAFRGPQGFVGVRLSARIHLTAVTLEHVPRALSPVSNITSAPKDFVILGLNEDSQVEGVALAKFTYDNAGEAIQTFHFQGNGTAPYQLVQLQVLSNWGHPDYTCIYRFRVHGKPAN
ncbi:SUN domain-containing protein 2-like isoform X2 [Phascolarctos cinereus]